MATVFISYSHEDHHFAELLNLKLQNKEHTVWLDNGALRAGEDWRNGIEKGIQESDVVLVVMSPFSVESSYVTYEWAFAIGRDKAVVPLIVKECKLHPRLEPVQYLDFSQRGNLPWSTLFERINEIEVDLDTPEGAPITTVRAPHEIKDPKVKDILSYLNAKGFQMVSFERLRARKVCNNLSDDELRELVKNNDDVFRLVRLRGGKRGVAKR